jgi:hypothetical protein
MTMRQVTEFAVVTLLMAAGTWLAGWWMVPVVAAAWGLTRREERGLPLLAAMAGAMAWTALLLLPSSPAAVGRVAEVAGRAMGVGAGPLLFLTLIYPALLAVSAAALARALAAREGAPTSGAPRAS